MTNWLDAAPDERDHYCEAFAVYEAASRRLSEADKPSDDAVLIYQAAVRDLKNALKDYQDARLRERAAG